MNEYTQITLDEWMQWKEDIRRKLSETAGNFVYIGYRLKQIRDSGMYDGASDVFEFAMKEYGLSKSTVSRFIAINERYSEGGNSLELKEEYRAFSSSKLAEMLTLSDNEIQMITDRTTIKEIRELKDFVRQEAQREEGVDEERTPLEKCLIDYFRTREEMLNGIMRYLEQEPTEYKKAAEQMNPSGQASHKKGIVFLFLYDWNTGIKYKLLTQPEPISLTWPELLDDVYRIYGACKSPDVWEDFYGGEATVNAVKTAPKETEQKTASTLTDQGLEPSVATSQQEQENNEANGESSTDGAGEERNTAAAVVEAESNENTEEEQIPGQDNILLHPEYLPEEREETSDAGNSDTGESGNSVDMSNGTAGDGIVEQPGDAEGVDREPEGVPEPERDAGKEESETSLHSVNTECEGAFNMTDEEWKSLWKDITRDVLALKDYVSFNTSEEVACNMISKERLEKHYKSAINVAAGLEKMINGKKYLT